ncbi:MAG TPA: exonuclease [Pricia antarctica]|uniref:Exonuclease n=2 Tax=root TaxID=1 RepID=A0A831QSB9_9FLAO|nr:exonuclease [Pricia antarctica]
MYSILDIETTGGKYNEEGITEIAIHKFDGHNVVDQFISLVNPEKEIQPFVVKLTGINNKMLRTAPKFHEIAKRIVEITEDSVLVAHNAQFDYRILRTEFRRLGYNFERKTLCTVDLSKKLIPEAESHSLGKLVRSLGIAVSDRHRANGDALATLKLFKILLTKDSDKTIIKDVIRKETQGELSDRQLDIVESIPSETGVYYMHDKDGEIIFLGKSSNMKKRVNQHFTKSGGRGRQLQKATKKVSYEKTGSELVALLKENEELIRNRPKYNPKPRSIYFSHTVCAHTDEHGYLVLRGNKAKTTNDSFATFNSMVAAENFIRKLTREFRLCDKLNGISEAKKNCSNYDSGECDGACIQKETTDSYNKKVEEAISKYSLKNKNIVIVDKGRDLGEYSAILIKDGHFKGLGFCDLNHQINNTHILESIITPMAGGDNTRHIIETYLRKRRVFKILDLK